MDQDSFRRHAVGMHRVPVLRSVPSDLDTPLSVYLKLADGPYSYLFESVEGGETWGRYSIIGLPARHVVRFHGRRMQWWEEGVLRIEREVSDPLAEVDALHRAWRVAPVADAPDFVGGLVGYFGFETIGLIEPRLQHAPPDLLGLPDIELMLSEELAVFDNLAGRLYLVVLADAQDPLGLQRAERRLDALAFRLRHSSPAYPQVLDPGQVDETDFISGFSRDSFEAAVRKAQDYIRAGDAFQVVLSQRLSVPFRARPVDVYRALRALNPSPYMFFLDLNGTQVVGSSPEILVRRSGEKLVVRPIAGTRPRGSTPEHDARLAAELLADPKELAEHLMLIDLGRNDIGRIAQTGSIEIPDRMVIERYSHVMHMVSQVQGIQRPGLSPMDILRATFPAGTLSGAPKVRAVEIIQELEPVKRGVYGGAVGYIGWDGDLDLAIAIRTAVIHQGQLHLQAGAGVVYDSEPASEWEETLNKGRAIIRAVSQAARGL